MRKNLLDRIRTATMISLSCLGLVFFIGCGGEGGTDNTDTDGSQTSGDVDQSLFASWAKQAGGTDVDGALGIACVSNDSYLMAGHFAGTTTFGKGETHETSLTSSGDWDIYLARFNADGTLAWVAQAGGTSNDGAIGVSPFSDGSCLITGWFSKTATFGKGQANETSLTAVGGLDLFVAKYNADGTLAWAKCAGGANNDCALSLAALSDGSGVVVGTFNDFAFFGPDETNQTKLTAQGDNDVFAAKYNADGTLAWAKRIGLMVETGAEKMGVSSILSVRAFSDNSFLVTGLFYDTATLGEGEANATSLVSAGECDIFLAKYSTDGTLAWAKRAGGTSADGALGISVLSDNSCLIGGHFEGTAVFGKNESQQTSLTSAGAGDIFLAKYNTDGTLAWAKRAGGTSNDAILGVSAFSDGSCSVTGSFCGTATFGKSETHEASVTSAGSEDIFVAQYAADGSLTWVVRAGGVYRDAGQCIVSLSGDTCVVGGVFLGTATFNEGSESEISLDTTGSYDIFLAKYCSD